MRCVSPLGHSRAMKSTAALAPLQECGPACVPVHDSPSNRQRPTSTSGTRTRSLSMTGILRGSLPQSPPTGASRGGNTKPLISTHAGSGADRWRGKLAALDWPPPPSPAVGFRRHSKTSLPVLRNTGSASHSLAATLGSVGTAVSAASDAFWMGDRDSQDAHAKSWAAKAAEARARGELWSLREEIQQEKLRAVAPFPFFGRAMRFQDEFSALQITDDGRFSYSAVSFEAPSTADERATSAAAGGGDKRLVITYEGVLVASSAADVEESTMEEREGGEASSIEGRAIVRHEVEESGGGKTRLGVVERGIFRFAIAVSPFYQPSGATVQPLQHPTSPGHLPHRKRHLPYVGPGNCRREPSTSKPRRYPRAKFYAASRCRGGLRAASWFFFVSDVHAEVF